MAQSGWGARVVGLPLVAVVVARVARWCERTNWWFFDNDKSVVGKIVGTTGAQLSFFWLRLYAEVKNCGLRYLKKWWLLCSLFFSYFLL